VTPAWRQHVLAASPGRQPVPQKDQKTLELGISSRQREFLILRSAPFVVAQLLTGILWLQVFFILILEIFLVFILEIFFIIDIV